MRHALQGAKRGHYTHTHILTDACTQTHTDVLTPNRVFLRGPEHAEAATLNIFLIGIWNRNCNEAQ